MDITRSLKKIWRAVVDRPTQIIDGVKIWRFDGNPDRELHRDFGRPAIMRSNGSQEWWVNGKLDRKDGPAVINADGTKQWYRDGQQMSESEFNGTAKKKKFWKFGAP